MEDDVPAGYLAKALESLESAKSELEAGRYNSCANRCYYACFQAAIAELVRGGIRASGGIWGHDFVQAQFSLHFINRRKVYGSDMGQTLISNRNLREQADYNTKPVIESQARRALARAHTFITAVRERIEANQ